MRKLFAVSGLVIATLVSSPVHAKKFITTIQSDYKVVKMSINDKPAAHIIFGLENVDGVIAVCGAYTMLSKGKNTRGGNFRTMMPKFLRKKQLTYDGVPLKLSGSHFKAIPNGNLLGQPAICRKTKVEWRKGLTNKKLGFKRRGATIRF